MNNAMGLRLQVWQLYDSAEIGCGPVGAMAELRSHFANGGKARPPGRGSGQASFAAAAADWILNQDH